MSDKKSEPSENPAPVHQPNTVGWENPRRWGKVAAMRKAAAEYIEQNPGARVVLFGKDDKPKEE